MCARHASHDFAVSTTLNGTPSSTPGSGHTSAKSVGANLRGATLWRDTTRAPAVVPAVEPVWEVSAEMMTLTRVGMMIRWKVLCIMNPRLWTMRTGQTEDRACRACPASNAMLPQQTLHPLPDHLAQTTTRRASRARTRPYKEDQPVASRAACFHHAQRRAGRAARLPQWQWAVVRRIQLLPAARRPVFSLRAPVRPSSRKAP